MISKTKVDLANQLQLAFHKFHRSKFEKVECIHGEINHGQIMVLMLIKNIGGEKVTSTDLAKKMGITKGAVAHHIKDLEDSGLLQKVSSEKDGRVFHLQITNKGEEYMINMKKAQNKHMQMIIDHIGVSDSEKLIEIINKLSNLPK